jgi:hypothetical protein
MVLYVSRSGYFTSFLAQNEEAQAPQFGYVMINDRALLFKP